MPDCSLVNRSVLITAGPTWVMLDAVRHLGNVSSGHTGLVLARTLSGLGAWVTLLLGPGRSQATAEDAARFTVVPFVTFDDLHALVREHVGSGRHEALIHAAAVSDYRPVEEVGGKISSEEEELIIRLRRTPKIVDEVRGLSPSILLVKFKLEVGRTEEELLGIARESRRRSDADLIVANDLTQIAEGRHVAYLLDGEGVIAHTDTAEELAEALGQEMARRLLEQRPG